MMIIDGLNRVTRILSVSLGQPSEVIVNALSGNLSSLKAE